MNLLQDRCRHFRCGEQRRKASDGHCAASAEHGAAVALWDLERQGTAAGCCCIGDVYCGYACDGDQKISAKAWRNRYQDLVPWTF